MEKQIEEILKIKERVLVSVVGKAGTGKSQFGKFIRKNGFGQYNKRIIAVIDDNLMKIEFLYLFQRRVKIPCKGIDELQPFFKKLQKRKKIVFFINNSPGKRIRQADILLKLSTGEDIRKKRLQQRNGKNPAKLQRFLNNGDVNTPDIKYSYILEGQV